MATPDVTVRGAGIFGLSVAWACLERGAHVRVIDPHGPGAGASGGIVGALAPHAPENWNAKKAFQLESLLSAGAFWQRVEAVSGIPSGYGRTGRLQPVADDAALERARLRGREAGRLWGDRARWEVIREDDVGWTPHSPTGWLVWDDLSARLNPRRACDSLAAAIRSRGGALLGEGEEAGAVVHATGWQGLRALSEALGAPVGAGVKGQALLLRHAGPEKAPQVLADGLHVVPHTDGTVALGSTTERVWDAPDQTDWQADALLDRAIEAMPILHGAAIVARWAGVRPRARSRSPILGPWPGRDGHFIANGGFKIGFGMAPGVAAAIADLVLEGRDRIPEDFRIAANL